MLSISSNDSSGQLYMSCENNGKMNSKFMKNMSKKYQIASLAITYNTLYATRSNGTTMKDIHMLADMHKRDSHALSVTVMIYR